MRSTKQDKYKDEQFLFMGKWTPKKHFRTFVYSKNNEAKLAKSYDEYEDLITSGLWFDEEQLASPKVRKQKDVICSDG